ncbi:MAG: MFS transporter, partial [Deltaproteobacteria bacterium]|nr:MFS transporter [Deltaproteobacteria bacterium]
MNFLSILKKENFRPLFWAMGLGAFNDNFMRQALIALVAFGPFGLTTSEKSALGGLSTSLLIIPFFLFSSLAGELADKESKSLLLKITKGVEVVFSLLAAYFFISGSLWLLLGTLFLMGLQSTFFGPLKYGLLPEVLDEKALMAGNSLVGAFSFLAIVAGSVAGSFLATLKNGPNLYVPVVLSLTALLGFYYALKQPPSLKLAPNLKIDPLIFRSTLIILADLKTRPDLLLIILAVSWFWGMGSIVLIQVPIMAASLMGTTPNVSTTLVCLLALGLGLGALGANRLVKGETTASLTPISAFVLCLITLSLSLCLHNLPPAIPGSVGLVDFFSTPIYLASAILCFLISFTGGLFVTPLYALMQRLSEQTRRARVIAANNI